jgi:hypothetical protein
MLFLLRIITLTVLLLPSLTESALTQSTYAPSEYGDDSQQVTRTESKRGCPINLGELTLIGNQIKTNKNPPVLVFIAKPVQFEKIIIAVGSIRHSVRVYYQEWTVSKEQIIWIDDLPKLNPNQEYQISAGIRCTGENYDKDKILQTSLTVVESTSEYDLKLDQYRDNPVSLMRIIQDD